MQYEDNTEAKMNANKKQTKSNEGLDITWRLQDISSIFASHV